MNKIIQDGIALDLEINPSDNSLLKIGAIDLLIEDRSLCFKGRFDEGRALNSLDQFCRNARFLLGHNISRYDIIWLKKKYPDLNLLSIPLIDTLFLSPLAFPENPYHRLVKDYKIVKESVNDPVADAKAAFTLFIDQIESFQNMEKSLAGFYRWALSLYFPDDFYGALFHKITGDQPISGLEARKIWLDLTFEKVCIKRAGEVFDLAVNAPESVVCLAYALAWIQVAGDNSVLPPWIRHQFPSIPALLDSLRATPCMQNDCVFCKKHYDLNLNLKQFFGFNDFLPVKNESPPIQRIIVEEIVKGSSCLAVLPTGAGKSLCYQLPGMIKARLRNQLVLIISPLQSLMKDQVDGLKKKGLINVGTINGLLTMLERSRTLEEVRMGDIDLLWLAPEQLRNTIVKSVIRQRELGLVVIDEAHCFSKWGHDFRTDYLYISRFLNENDSCGLSGIPQIVCFTATAKKEVINEIRTYFKTELDLELVIFEGGYERTNLNYQVENVIDSEKAEIIHNILSDVLKKGDADGGGIVFASTRARVENFSRILAKKGWAVDYFHGGRTPEDKKMVQENFIDGEFKVITATNAFGMGVDKPDIRVVIHADIPGSLENYLQEAGRAGRDRKPATCVLLFDPEDLETQFKLNSFSRLEWRDISGFFTGLKHLAFKNPERNPERNLVLTSGELLRTDEIDEQNLTDISMDEPMYDTKVKTALAWLEKSGKLLRGDNRTQVVQGQVMVENMALVREKISGLRLSSKESENWLRLLEVLFQSDQKELLNTDNLSLVTGIEPEKLISIMHSMRDAGIINHDINMTAYVHKGVADDSLKRFQKYMSIEQSLLSIMEEEHPDMDADSFSIIRPGMICRIMNEEKDINARPDRILLLLELMSQDNLLRRTRAGDDTYKIFFKADWPDIKKAVHTRTSVSMVILQHLLAKLSVELRGRDLLVSFRSGELSQALKDDISTRHLQKTDEKVKQALLALHTMRSICLQSGLSVFRPAMTIQVTAHKNERFTKNEFRPLEEFHKQKVIQVHIIGRYAEYAMETVKKALTFVTSYFSSEKDAFLKIYFNKELKILEMPTTRTSFNKIVTELDNPVQEKAVTAPRYKNLLIVAGPGSGKTRIIVHRIAYLIRVKRILPRHIMALAFNRSAVTQLKLRLKELIGREAGAVRIRTYHSLALSITGSLKRERNPDKNDSAFFSGFLKDAVEILSEESGLDHGAMGWRDTVLSGLRYILVDEYQDINELEYRFLSILAGRNEKDTGRRPSIMVVGDDDQNIYSWQGSNVKFIHNFQKDYDAEIVYMMKNYRSSGAIIKASNALISNNKDRMKTTPIKPAGMAKNPVADEKVTLIKSPDLVSTFRAALELAENFLKSDQSIIPSQICILCRTNKELDTIQIMARKMSIPVKSIRPRRLPLVYTREFLLLLNLLGSCRQQILKPETLNSLVSGLIQDSGFSANNIWLETFRSIMDNYLAEIAGARLPVGNFIDYIYDAARDPRQLIQTDEKKILLATMHMAKGLEFPVVIIAGQPISGQKMEDERRLYYVAMTRAMHQLFCLHNDATDNPFINEITDCGQVIRKTVKPVITEEETSSFNTLIWELELTDIIISFPVWKRIKKKSQTILAGLEPGNSRDLFIKKYDDKYTIYCRNFPIARLSAKGAAKYRKLLEKGMRTKKIIFLASIRWSEEVESNKQKIAGEDKGRWFTGLYQIVMG